MSKDVDALAEEYFRSLQEHKRYRCIQDDFKAGHQSRDEEVERLTKQLHIAEQRERTLVDELKVRGDKLRDNWNEIQDYREALEFCASGALPETGWDVTREIRTKARAALSKYKEHLLSKSDRCPCGGIILADTEDCPTPLCNNCTEQVMAAMKEHSSEDFVDADANFMSFQKAKL